MRLQAPNQLTRAFKLRRNRGRLTKIPVKQVIMRVGFVWIYAGRVKVNVFHIRNQPAGAQAGLGQRRVKRQPNLKCKRHTQNC